MRCLERRTTGADGRGFLRLPTLVAALTLASGLPAAAQPPTTTLVYPPWSHCYGLHRVNQTHLTLRAGFRYRFDDPQGLAALKLDAEDDPKNPRDDDELTVFGVNSGQHMLIYNTSLTAIAFYGRHGDGVGEFERPHGIAADRAGHVVVADTGNRRLHVLQYAGDKLTHVRFVTGGAAGRPLGEATGVALEGGEIYACAPAEPRILVFDLEGNLRRELCPTRAGEPLLDQPFAIDVMRADSEHNFFGDDFVAVTDSAHSRLWRLDPESGQPQAVRRVRDLGSGRAEFYDVAIDYHANVYASDRGGRLHKFDRGLVPLLTIGKPGTGDYEFDEPRGIGLYRRFGQMFVAERAGAQYLWIGTDVFTPSVVAIERQAGGTFAATLRFFLTEQSRVGFDLVDATGLPLADIQAPAWTPPGTVERRLRFSAPAGAASVAVRVTAVPTYSARKVLRVVKRTPPFRLDAAREVR